MLSYEPEVKEGESRTALTAALAEKGKKHKVRYWPAQLKQWLEKQ